MFATVILHISTNGVYFVHLSILNTLIFLHIMMSMLIVDFMSYQRICVNDKMRF